MKKSIALLLAFVLCLGLCPARAEEAPSASPAPQEKPVVTSAITAELTPPACKAAVLMEGETGELLYVLNGDVHNYPASITKVMTALLTLEAVERGELGLEQMITASNTFSVDLSADGSTQNIKPGEVLSVHELLYCALVPSANEACNILGEAVAGNLSDFILRMNQRAAELGMENTHFMNAHGLHNANHYTTAHDVALLVREALQNDTFATIVSAKNHVTPATNLSEERRYVNTNALLTPAHYPGYVYANAIGVKMGTTPEAGQCLASAAVKGGRTLICVVLGAENTRDEEGNLIRHSFLESRRLLEWGFDSFSHKTLLDTKEPLKEIPVTLSADVSAVALKPQEALSATLPNDMDPADFQRDVTLYYSSVEAPVTEGQILGEVTVRNGETVYGTVKLVAAASAERSELLYRLDQIKRFFGNFWVRVGLVAFVVLLLVIILRVRAVRRRNRRRGYRGRR